MIDLPTIDELRETRRRLAEQSGLDVQRLRGLAAAVRADASRTLRVPPRFCPNRCPRSVSRLTSNPSTPGPE